MDTNNKIYIEADLIVHKETDLLKEKASKVINLPSAADKQPDLMYFSAIFVSSGENLNHAYFAGSELIAAEGSIINKALDVEHVAGDIIGHLYDRAYITKDGEPIDLAELASKEKAAIDNQDMHIAVAGIIYKSRFPEVAAAVAANKYKVSMECFYSSFDVKVGNVIMSRVEAESLGIASVDDCIGKQAKVIRDGKEVSSGKVARVLRNICFSGCGIVENPANPPSIILEVANKDSEVVFNYDNKVTPKELEKHLSETATDGNMDDTVGICVYYKRFVNDKEGNNVGNDVCAYKNTTCTSFNREATDSACLLNIDVVTQTKECFASIINRLDTKDRRKSLLAKLQVAIEKSKRLKH